MKLKPTIAALLVSSMSFLPAQDAPPKEAPAQEAPDAPKPEGPFETRAFRIFDKVAQLPEILGSIKDEASLKAAQTKLDALGESLEKEATEIAKTEVPSNEVRQKLATKMKAKEKTMENKMRTAMAGMSQLDPALGEQVGQMFMGFAGKMEKIGPTMEKYFEPDEEAEEGE